MKALNILSFFAGVCTECMAQQSVIFWYNTAGDRDSRYFTEYNRNIEKIYKETSKK